MALSIEQLESWEKEAGIHFDKLEEVDEMIHRKTGGQESCQTNGYSCR